LASLKSYAMTPSCRRHGLFLTLYGKERGEGSIVTPRRHGEDEGFSFCQH